MDKIITLPAGKDRLIIQHNGKDWWCPVYVAMAVHTRLLGYNGWKDIIVALLRGLEDSYHNKEIGKYSIFNVSGPHGAMYLNDKGDYDQLDFVGPDAPSIFHSMTLSRAEKQQWINTLQKTTQG